MALVLRVFLAVFLMGSVAEAQSVVARVDVSEQRMRVYSNGQHLYTWPVSTARKGKYTPRGRWSAKHLSKHHRSSLYNGAKMPFSIFYSGNYAVHGTMSVSKLGRPASAGCVRLHPDNAATLFYMTQKVGLQNMVVEVKN